MSETLYERLEATQRLLRSFSMEVSKPSCGQNEFLIAIVKNQEAMLRALTKLDLQRAIDELRMEQASR